MRYDPPEDTEGDEPDEQAESDADHLEGAAAIRADKGRHAKALSALERRGQSATSAHEAESKLHGHMAKLRNALKGEAEPKEAPEKEAAAGEQATPFDEAEEGGE